ncbi:hypothetical protein V8F20_004514 [Naviculisporaceae sp. PSN 640]
MHQSGGCDKEAEISIDKTFFALLGAKVVKMVSVLGENQWLTSWLVVPAVKESDFRGGPSTGRELSCSGLEGRKSGRTGRCETSYLSITWKREYLPLRTNGWVFSHVIIERCGQGRNDIVLRRTDLHEEVVKRGGEWKNIHGKEPHNTCIPGQLYLRNPPLGSLPDRLGIFMVKGSKLRSDGHAPVMPLPCNTDHLPDWPVWDFASSWYGTDPRGSKGQKEDKDERTKHADNSDYPYSANQVEQGRSRTRDKQQGTLHMRSAACRIESQNTAKYCDRSFPPLDQCKLMGSRTNRHLRARESMKCEEARDGGKGDCPRTSAKFDRAFAPCLDGLSHRRKCLLKGFSSAEGQF